MTKVEQVARAIYDANCWHERVNVDIVEKTQEWRKILYEALPDDEREVLVKQARAAIAAMDPPSEGMLEAGHRAARATQRPSIGGMTMEAQLRAESVREAAAWCAMVAAALEEQA